MGRPKIPYSSEFRAQKQNARRRGISFEFTYDTWIDWWGLDIEQRGKGAEKLVMARKEDQGSYHPDNVYKDTGSNNVSLGNKNKIITDDYREKLSIASFKRWGTYKEEHTL
jgi:hypothetical protein